MQVLNSMYLFEETNSDDMFSRQNTTINNLPSETADIGNEANALRDINEPAAVANRSSQAAGFIM